MRAEHTAPTHDETQAQARALADAARERGAEDVSALAVGELCSFASLFVLCTGRSDRNVRAIADAVREAAKRCGLNFRGIEGYEAGRWVLLDLGDAIVHIFLAEARAHYDLDRLWSDAPQLLHAANARTTKTSTPHPEHA